jgi:hypothetical protein
VPTAEVETLRQFIFHPVRTALSGGRRPQPFEGLARSTPAPPEERRTWGYGSQLGGATGKPFLDAMQTTVTVPPKGQEVGSV